MPRIHVPVFTERSAISSKTGSGASRISAGRSLVSVRQASPGRPLITMAQLPQMPARQTKSNASDGSRFSRISLSAMNSVMPARGGRDGLLVAHGSLSSMRSLRPRRHAGSRCS